MDRDERAQDDVGLRWGIHLLLRGGVYASGGMLAGGLLAGSSSLLRAGIFVLICTPIARVAALAAGYAKRRDWPFFWVSFGVLALLGVGALMGVRH